MANITPSMKVNKKFVRSITWVGKDADTFLSYKVLGVSPRNISVQAVDGASTLVGSLDNTNFFSLTDFQGNNISLADGELSEVSQTSLYIKPSGIASTIALADVTVTVTIWR